MLKNQIFTVCEYTSLYNLQLIIQTYCCRRRMFDTSVHQGQHLTDDMVVTTQSCIHFTPSHDKGCHNSIIGGNCIFSAQTFMFSYHNSYSVHIC